MSLRFAELPPVLSATSVEEKHEYPDVLCPDCGAPTKARADGSVLCSNCLQQADWRAPLQEHVKQYPKLLSFARCTQCERVHSGGHSWDNMDHESSELLGFLLRRVKRILLGKRALAAIEGMSRALDSGTLNLEDARLIYTEPHSLRVRVEVVMKYEPGIARSTPGTRHKCELEFIEERKLCNQCAGETPKKMGKTGKDDFAAKIQVRVRRSDGGHGGERTLRALEDSLRLTSASKTATSARTVSRNHNGFDVEFAHRNDAQKFLNELKRLGRAPLKFVDETRKLLTHDAYSNTSDFQRTTLVWLPPIDKHDLVIFATTTNKFALVLAVRSSLRLADISNSREFNLSADAFFHSPFDPILSTQKFVHFRILTEQHCVRAEKDDEKEHAVPRTFYSPFTCKPGSIYRGYDLDTIAHRVHIPAHVPRVVIVLPIDIKTSSTILPEKNDSTSKNQQILSRKERRRQAKKEREMNKSPPHAEKTRGEEIDDDR